MISYYLLGRDLRVRDNATLVAANHGARYLMILHAWPKDFANWGEAKQKFYTESLACLQKSLAAQGQQIFSLSDAEHWFGELPVNNGDRFYISAEYHSRFHQWQKQLQQDLNARGVSLAVVEQATLYQVQDLPFPIEDLPASFSSFRNKIEKKGVPVRGFLQEHISLLPPPPKPLLSPLKLTSSTNQEAGLFPGGELAGLARLQYYFWQSERPKTYKDTRNGMLEFDDSTKFSPYLAWGCISVQRIYRELLEYERLVEHNESTYWIWFELLWRDYFKFLAQKYADKIFKRSGIQAKSFSALPKTIEQQMLTRWCEGETEYEFVNANMLELKHTGWMSNRGRQNVASYLAKECGVDWTLGAQYFADQLIDYDVESNWGNWAYQAGVSVDPRDRRFSILRQQEMYDPDGAYRKKFLGAGYKPVT